MTKRPNTTNEVVAVKEVKRIIQAEDADATAGWTFMACITIRVSINTF